MNPRRAMIIYAIIVLVVGVFFAFIHLSAHPDDAPISLIQRLVAALANLFGPWAGPIVRLVDFPNAGLRSFRWILSVGMTLIGAILIILGAWVKPRFVQYGLIIMWVIFIVLWFGVGLMQIADGLL